MIAAGHPGISAYSVQSSSGEEPAGLLNEFRKAFFQSISLPGLFLEI